MSLRDVTGPSGPAKAFNDQNTWEECERRPREAAIAEAVHSALTTPRSRLDQVVADVRHLLWQSLSDLSGTRVVELADAVEETIRKAAADGGGEDTP